MTEAYLFSQFHFLYDISFIFGKGVNMTSLETYPNTCFQLLLTLESSDGLHQKAPCLSRILARNFDSCFVSEENTLAILDSIGSFRILSTTVTTGKYVAECNLRLLAAIYSKIRKLHQPTETQKLLPSTVSPSTSLLT